MKIAKIRLTRGFGWGEMCRCIRSPFVAFRRHHFCWGRILFWYIDFKIQKGIND